VQALDLCTRALRSIGAYATGEPIDSDDFNDCLDTLNDMLATWSNATLMVPYVSEIIHTLQPNLEKYTLGPGGTIGGTFTGSIAVGPPPTLTVSAIPLGNIALGMTITGAGVSPGTKITQFQTGAGDIGTYIVNVPQTVGSVAMQSSYERPLRINSGFVRVSGIDYPITPMNIERFELLGLKKLNGPWPRAVYYQPTSPIGNITYYPVPSSGEVHLFVETVLQGFTTLSDTVNLPQGYAAAIRWNLAEQLLPEYGKGGEVAQIIMKHAASSRAWVKRTNSVPPQVMSFDPELLGRPGRVDAGFFLHGGFLP
jgi:hypothetical protein